VGSISWKVTVQSLKVDRLQAPKKVLTVADFKKMVNHLEKSRRPKDIRDLALIRLLFDVALRRAEIASLDMEHLDLDNSTILVLGKGRSEREELVLPAPTVEALSKWVRIREEHHRCLFHNFNHVPERRGRLTSHSINGMVRTLGKSLKLGSISSMSLRHAAITEALNVTQGDVRAVQQFSRHKRVDTVVIYDDLRNKLGSSIAHRLAESLEDG
jgi:integrase/recombinase XerC